MRIRFTILRVILMVRVKLAALFVMNDLDDVDVLLCPHRGLRLIFLFI
jgi:hypothetical protein